METVTNEDKQSNNNNPTINCSKCETCSYLPANLLFHCDNELQEYFNFQKENGIWNFYQEREFIENLFCKRFNYFLVIIAIFLGGALTAKSQTNFIIVLSIGLIYTALMAFTIYRNYKKLIILLKIMYKLGDNHVFPIVAKEIKFQRDFFSFGVNHLIGIWIPLLSVLIFLIGLILAVCGIFYAY